MDFSESLSLVGGLGDAVLVQYCQDVSAVLLDVLSLGDDGVVEMTGSTEEIVGQPVLVVVLHLGVQEVGDKLGECGDLVVPEHHKAWVTIRDRHVITWLPERGWCSLPANYISLVLVITQWSQLTITVVIKPWQTLIRSHSLQPNTINDVNGVVFYRKANIRLIILLQTGKIPEN